jgi:hypothetical protein
MTKSLVILFLLTLPVFAQDQAAAARAAAGCGPKEINFDVKTDGKQHPMPEPESGKSLIVIFQAEKRDSNINYLGRHPTTRVGLDGAWIGANRGKSYLFHATEPGDHRLCSDWQSSLHSGELGSAVTFTAEAGKVYYSQANIEERPNYPAGVKLEQIDGAQGQFLIASSSLSSSQAKK